MLNSFKYLPMPATEPMKSIIYYTIPAKDDIESRYIKAFLRSCYQDKYDPNPSAFASLFIHEVYKEHLSKLKLYIAIKNNDKKTAIDWAKTFNKKNIVMYLEDIENAKGYKKLNKGLKKQIEINYQQLGSVNEI